MRFDCIMLVGFPGLWGCTKSLSLAGREKARGRCLTHGTRYVMYSVMYLNILIYYLYKYINIIYIYILYIILRYSYSYDVHFGDCDSILQ